MSKIDTTKDGFEYIGINLTDEQYEELCQLNIFAISPERQEIPVFHMMVLLKIIGLLPSEMINDEGRKYSNYNPDDDFIEYLQRKFGKVKK